MKSKENEPLSGLAAIDYKDLNGDNFVKYQEYENSLNEDVDVHYELWAGVGILKYTIDEDSGDKTKVLKGIKLNSSSPKFTTKIPPKFAKNHNAQIMAQLGNLLSTYYLLKKTDTSI